nr:unnamed protein product [Callosobruchus chinensis]
MFQVVPLEGILTPPALTKEREREEKAYVKYHKASLTPYHSTPLAEDIPVNLPQSGTVASIPMLSLQSRNSRHRTRARGERIVQ